MAFEDDLCGADSHFGHWDIRLSSGRCIDVHKPCSSLRRYSLHANSVTLESSFREECCQPVLDAVRSERRHQRHGALPSRAQRKWWHGENITFSKRRNSVKQRRIRTNGKDLMSNSLTDRRATRQTENRHASAKERVTQFPQSNWRCEKCLSTEQDEGGIAGDHEDDLSHGLWRCIVATTGPGPIPQLNKRIEASALLCLQDRLYPALNRYKGGRKGQDVIFHGGVLPELWHTRICRIISRRSRSR